MSDNSPIPSPDVDSMSAGGDQEEPQTAEWTIMIFMAGDNNLADDCVNALRNLQQVKTRDTVHVVAQFDPSDTRISTQRIVINRKDKKAVLPAAVVPDSPSTLAQDSVKIEQGSIPFDDQRPRQAGDEIDPGETDTADPKTLFDFISWSQEKFPAKHYLLVFAGHASGIQEGYLLKDENPAHAMTLQGLKQVLAAVKTKLPIHLDILGMDSCLMSMVEICYELKDLNLVDYFVSSQSMTPNPGWPYSQIVESLIQAGGDLDGNRLAPIIVNKYVNSYVENAVNSGLATDLSALKVSASGTVADRIRELATAIKGKLGDGPDTEFNKALIHAHWEAQSYNGELFVDLGDFCELLEQHCNDEGVMNACGEVRKAINEMVVAACFCGIDYQYSNGVSIYFPWSTIFSYYRNLAFNQKGGADWFDFLSAYVEATRRQPRGGDAPGPSNRFLVFVRRQPPFDHGPSGQANSMRNPPRKWSKNGIKACIERKEEWGHLFDSFQ